MFQLPSDFQPTDEYAKGHLGMSLADYYKSNPGAQQAYQGSSAGLNEQAQNDKVANEAKQTALFTQGKNDITDFLGRYNAAVPSIINTTSSKYNIPQQLTNVNALNTRIQTLKGNLDNSGSGGYSSGQQIDSAVNSRYLPTYGTAMTNLLTSGTQAQNEENLLTAPYTTEATMLNDRLAREATGFSEQQQRELDQYKAMLDSNTTLTKAQMDNANELAKAQLAYNQAINSAKITAQNQTIASGSTYYNPVTGQYYNPTTKVTSPS